MAEGVTAMLSESGLPASFWGEALASYVHVWNRLPTSAISKATTPFELSHGSKPDVGDLRVWGCTAYVHVQRDQRQSLEPHMCKLVFIGYPTGYKGWKFWDLTSKCSIICERADFDERYFPARKDASPIPIPSLLTPEPVSESVPSQGERMHGIEPNTDSDDPVVAPVAPVAPVSPRISPSPSVEQQSPTP